MHTHIARKLSLVPNAYVRLLTISSSNLFRPLQAIHSQAQTHGDTHTHVELNIKVKALSSKHQNAKVIKIRSIDSKE